MNSKELKEALDGFAENVVKDSKRNLKRKGKGGGALDRSISQDVKVMPNSFSLEILMEEYGAYIDKGVKGRNPNKVSKNAKIRGQQAPQSEFKFGSGKTKGYSKWVSSLELWAKKKNIRFRDSKGRFKKGSYKTMAHVIAGNIYNRGLKPTMFLTKPFEKHFGKLPDAVIEAYGLDVDDLLNYSINNNFKNVNHGNDI